MAVVSIEKFTEELELDIIYDADKTELEILTGNVNRPGLQLSGFFDYFASDRVQIFGKVEITYMEEVLEHEGRLTVMDKLFSYPIPCIIISRNQKPPEEMLDMAKKYGKPIFRSRLVTTKLIHMAISFLEILLAPVVTRHGVLMDIYGVGLFLTGESGIGKSETALELIKRGHRLVADDAVEITRIGRNSLVGRAPSTVRHFMELRGIGIVDIERMYGISAVLDRKTIGLVIEMERWIEGKAYDRLGVDNEFISIMGIRLPQITVPVAPGRNLAIIMEAAARNYRLKNEGYNAVEELTRLLMNEE